MKKYCMKCMRGIPSGDVCPECGTLQPQRQLPHLLPPGTILKERYLVGSALGQGGFGITYIGCDLLLDLRVAIKEYYPSGYANRNVFSSTEVNVTNPQHSDYMEEGLEKFLREARVLAEFHDAEGIVDVRDFFRENQTAYIVMEYLDGITMGECIRNRLIAPELMVDLMTPVLDSLERIHEKQVIHRDISPDNIMLMRSGKLKLMDFGAARQIDFSDQKSMSVVLKGGYAPVEQYRPKGQLGPWTDIYALCATMYVCMTGMHPDNALERVFSDTVKWPRELGVPMTESLERVLKKGMAVAWRDRYQSVAELREALQNALAAPEEPSAQPARETLSKPVEKDRSALSLVILSVLRQKNEEEKMHVSGSDSGKGALAGTIAVIEDEKKDRGVHGLPVDGPKEAGGDGDPASPGNPDRPKTKIAGEDRPSESPEQESGREKAEKQPAGPARRRMLAASVVLVILLLAGAAFGAINGFAGSSARESDARIQAPSYVVMMVDARELLESENVQGEINMTVNSRDYNEKFKTYTAECTVDAEGTVYTVKLIYSDQDGNWVFNEALSKVTG